MSEIEDMRAQLMESNAMLEASRKREAVAARTRHESSSDPMSVIDGAKRELYKVTWGRSHSLRIGLCE